MMYKVGDKVRIRQWKALVNDPDSWACDRYGNLLPQWFDVEPYCGKVMTISEVWQEDNNIIYFNFKEARFDGPFNEHLIEGHAFKYGDIVEFSNDGEKWEEGVYLGYIDGAKAPYVVTNCDTFKMGMPFDVVMYKYARPIQKKHTIIIDGKRIKISEESYRAFKSLLKED